MSAKIINNENVFLTCCLVVLLAFLPVLKCKRLNADVAVAMRSSGGRGVRGPDCELTVILPLVLPLIGRGLLPPDGEEEQEECC